MKGKVHTLEKKVKTKKQSFKIERGLVIPPTAAKSCPGRESAVDWPFARMKKGESILVPLNLANAAAVRIRREGFDKTDFTTRRLEDGIRIWRISNDN